MDKVNDEVAEWAAKNFPYENRGTISLGIAEEVGELCRAVLKQHQGIRGTYADWDKEIKKELGDVYIKLVHLATFCQWDLTDIILDRWDEVKRRDWIKDKIGHGIPADYADSAE